MRAGERAIGRVGFAENVFQFKPGFVCVGGAVRGAVGEFFGTKPTSRRHFSDSGDYVVSGVCGRACGRRDYFSAARYSFRRRRVVDWYNLFCVEDYDVVSAHKTVISEFFQVEMRGALRVSPACGVVCLFHGVEGSGIFNR